MPSKITKEGPILFNGAMVRAIIDGRKTQTRRIVKPQPEAWSHDTVGYELAMPECRPLYPYSFCKAYCKLGEVGDRLWVRETCRAEELPSGLDGVRYAADDAFREIENTEIGSDLWFDLFSYSNARGKQVPSIHMPRWASRINLEITGVRVERLNEISRADAIAEGCEMPTQRKGMHPWPEIQFESLWESINGTGSWAANPFVWVVEFKRV